MLNLEITFLGHCLWVLRHGTLTLASGPAVHLASPRPHPSLQYKSGTGVHLDSPFLIRPGI